MSKYFIIADATGYGNYVACERVSFLDTGWVKFLRFDNFVEAAIAPGFPGYFREIPQEEYDAKTATINYEQEE